MDIRKWLQNTADREPPEQDDDAHQGFPDYRVPQRHAAHHATRSKRKRGTSNSPPSSARRRPRQGFSKNINNHQQHAALSPSSSDQLRPSADATSCSSHSTYSSKSRESKHSARERSPPPIKTYERRARHKTRPDRYDPKPKKRKTKDHESRGEKSKSKRRKSHRSGDGTRTNGLVQNFQLKSGPKNNRLTLKPDLNSGIFKHGRASTRTAANGAGLPDLVFNEMKFLQKPKEHQDEFPFDEAAAGERAKKSKKQLQEAEISSYFARKPLPEKTPRQKEYRSHSNGSDALKGKEHDASRQKRSTKPNEQAQEPPVELPDKAFLGFGSRGPAQGGDENRHSNSYYTWSESIPARSPGPPPNGHADSRRRQTSRLSSISVPRKRADNSAHGQSRDHERDFDGNHESEQWIASRREKVPTLVKEYRRPLSRKRPQQRANARSSLSLPRGDLEDSKTDSPRTTSFHEAGSYRTSDILRIREIQNQAERSASLHAPKYLHEVSDKENQPFSTSTPTSELLRQAFGAVANPLPHDQMAAQNSHVDDLQAEQTWSANSNHALPTSRYTAQVRDPPGYGIISEDARETGYVPLEHLPRRGFDRSNDVPMAYFHESRDSQEMGFSHLSMPPPRSMRTGVPRDHGASLRANTTLAPPQSQSAPFFASSREAEELVRRLAAAEEHEMFDQPPELFGGNEGEFVESYALEPQIGHAEYDEDEALDDVQNFATEAVSVYEQSLDGLLRRGQEPQQQEEDIDDERNELMGFWRPNPLY